MKAKDFVGGRGKKVSYETEMFRIPTLLKPTVQLIGLQFRLQWDGLSDPQGKNLISRLQLAIPNIEQPADTNKRNQISGKQKVPKPDSKYKEDEEDADADVDEIEEEESDQSDEQTIRDQAANMQKYLTNVRMLEREAEAAAVELSELRSRVKDLAADRDGWQASAEQWAVVAEQSQTLVDAMRLELVEARLQLTECQQDCKRDAVERQRLEADVIALQVNLADMREQVNNQAAQVEERYEEVEQRVVFPEVIAILQNAIKTPDQGGKYSRSNGSGVKKAVEQALKLLSSDNE